MNEVRLPQGTIHYRESGTGDPIVLVHGLLADGELWRDVAPRLGADFRVIAPDWPLGSHKTPLKPGSDLSPLGLAGVVAAFPPELDLRTAPLVANDTAGAICHLAPATHPELLARRRLRPGHAS